MLVSVWWNQITNGNGGHHHDLNRRVESLRLIEIGGCRNGLPILVELDIEEDGLVFGDHATNRGFRVALDSIVSARIREAEALVMIQLNDGKNLILEVILTSDNKNCIDPDRFYGKDHMKLCGPEDKAQQQQRERLRMFPKQQMAFDFVDRLTKEKALELGQGWVTPSVFSVQDPKTGVRKFVAMGRSDVLRFMLDDLSPLSRHVYEIVREEATCRLYFDLEYKYERNAGGEQVGNEMVDIVVKSCDALLSRLFRIHIRKRDVIELDSSSETKFSRHLIFHLPEDARFRNNRVCGEFARMVYEYARDKLVVFTPDGGITSFVDLGVYTRNRAFRTFLSCKYGSTRILEPKEGRSMFPFDDNTREGVLGLLEASMIAPPGHADQNEPKILDFFSEGIAVVERRIGPKSERQVEIPSQTVGCPFPRIETAILNHAFDISGRTTRPVVRAWSLEEDENHEPVQLILNLKGNRYCQRIGRPHKSNNVFYVYKFQDKSFVQRCYDPECKGFTSKTSFLQ